MLLPQEVAARAVIPALRAMVAKKLIEKHGITQLKVAEHLGITQAAVSNYVREARGTMFSPHNGRKVQQMSDEITDVIMSGADKSTIRRKFTDVCNYIQASRLMCDAHRKLEPEMETTECHICDNHRYAASWRRMGGA